jgi:hypothetical protein
MTARAREIAATIRTLTDLVRREARALKRRSVADLAAIAVEKRTLADRLETALTPPQESLSAETRRDLERLQALSSENALHLASLRDSIARARLRLETLVEAERSAGLYGAHGKGRFASLPAAGRNA